MDNEPEDESLTWDIVDVPNFEVTLSKVLAEILTTGNALVRVTIQNQKLIFENYDPADHDDPYKNVF